MHLALARKYRPQNFLEVIGQKAIVKTLQNAIEAGRLHHAYLFCGVRGVGKTSLARILAKSINCLKGPTITPCQVCDVCQSITMGNSLDVIEIDGASNNLVDDVRELREQVKFLPASSRHKIYIIDEVHMLSNSAFNALLKTLEEPPAHVKFIFATTEAHKLPLTILSRCQKFDFRKLTQSALQGHLKNIAEKENLKIEAEALHLISQCAQGSVRDALSLLDQVASQTEEFITETQIRGLLGLAERLLVQNIFAKIITENLNDSLAILSEADQKGIDLKLFAEDLLASFRHLILLKSTGKSPEDLSPSETDFYTSLKDNLDLSLLLTQYQILFKTIQELAYTDFPKTVFEIALVKLANVKDMIGLTELVEKIKSKTPAVTTAPSQNIMSLRAPQSGAWQSDTKCHPEQREGPHGSPRLFPQDEKSRDDMASSWYKLVKWITQEKPPLGSLLRDVVPIGFGADKIEIGVVANSPTKSMLIERVSTIEDLMKKHFGRKMVFSITDISNENTASPETEKKKALSFGDIESEKEKLLREKITKEIGENQVIDHLIKNHGAKIKEIKIV